MPRYLGRSRRPSSSPVPRLESLEGRPLLSVFAGSAAVSTPVPAAQFSNSTTSSTIPESATQTWSPARDVSFDQGLPVWYGPRSEAETFANPSAPGASGSDAWSTSETVVTTPIVVQVSGWQSDWTVRTDNSNGDFGPFAGTWTTGSNSTASTTNGESNGTIGAREELRHHVREREFLGNGCFHDGVSLGDERPHSRVDRRLSGLTHGPGVRQRADSPRGGRLAFAVGFDSQCEPPRARAFVSVREWREHACDARGLAVRHRGSAGINLGGGRPLQSRWAVECRGIG